MRITEEQKVIVRRCFELSQFTNDQIAFLADVTRKHVYRFIHNTFSKEAIAKRKAINYRYSKLAAKNPMFGKFGAAHPNYIGDISDGKGYILNLKPAWYKGRVGCKHVFKHVLVVCERLGLSKLPAGYVVHHCDGDKHNNAFENLVLLTTGLHNKLHRYLKTLTIAGATTISKESTLKWVEAHGGATTVASMI